jgi:L,D-transpeptidase catalytic domain
MRRELTTVFTALALLGVHSASLATPQELVSRLVQEAPGINPGVLALAVSAVNCASPDAAPGAVRRLAVIDYSRPSSEQRLWVFDLSAAKLLYLERVAHGRGTGDNRSEHFSNLPGSFQSSLGLFQTRETYLGSNGYSLRLDGLDPGFNDRARERAIVIHGASYVSDATVKVRGGVGRSHGCPAVRREIARTLIDTIKGGQYLFAYFPDGQWLRRSAMLSCKAPRGD